ncbi:S8 family serine peptidase [Jatrophihabitans endophyticus]|nr:S8 family serine peptidase [Jatrophihabitans endophyticus]
MPAGRALAAGLLAAAGVVLPSVPAATATAAATAPRAAAPGSCEQAPTPGVPIPATAPRDPLLEQLGLDHAWPLSTGTGVTVGIVDTGVDPASPKLAGAVQLGRSYHVVDTKAVYADAPDGRVDCDGHGTEIAGIVAGRTEAGDDRVSGVAPGASVYPVSIQGDIGQVPSALVAAAITDAARHASVINLSFAQPADHDDIRAAVKYAVAHDVVVVAASANEAGGAGGAGGSTRAKQYPAAYPGVLAVAAVDADDAPVSGASTGSWISIAAPGDSLTTVPRGGKGYVTVTGTSFATGVVSGAAALLRSRFPHLSAAGVIARLERSAVPPGDGGRADAVGAGVVDPYAALTDARGPASAGPGAAAGRVPIARTHDDRGDDGHGAIVGTAAVLAALAVVIGTATISVRAGRRRGWVAGRRRRRAVDEREVRPHPAQLG